ncbi:hypothetical protein O181_036073 [Austropuccinia psidii MF-1]|uniref:Uncharacterized protein n=1 Tax=Austropuccinia psidii MF-1 TaxID=1389203 RepID=A0A9Q3H8V0_9BASI|nr:hypothetical protein [Austropuccinia psidii MF-1]
MFSKTEDHSNDEYIYKNTYKINKLNFCSENATKFMRCVDEEIEKVETIEGKQSKRQNRIEVNPPNLSTYSLFPKSLPIDFYNPQWFNNCPVGQKTVVSDAFKVAFLPDASKYIHGIKNPDKRLSDQKFTKKYWERCTEDYDLSHKIVKEDKD